MADLRNGYDRDDIIRWMPTSRMGADALTKHIPDPEELIVIIVNSSYSLVFRTRTRGGSGAMKRIC